MTTRKLQNATRFQIQPRGQCFTMNCTEAMKTQREQSTHRATRSQNDVPNDMMINVSMPRKVHVTQGQTHTWTKLPWNTPTVIVLTQRQTSRHRPSADNARTEHRIPASVNPTTRTNCNRYKPQPNVQTIRRSPHLLTLF